MTSLYTICDHFWRHWYGDWAQVLSMLSMSSGHWAPSLAHTFILSLFNSYDADIKKRKTHTICQDYKIGTGDSHKAIDRLFYKAIDRT